MKKHFLILVLSTILIPACRYEEGPAISFRTVRQRLIGRWEVTAFNAAGLDSLQYYKDSCNCEIVFVDRKDSYWERDNIMFSKCRNIMYGLYVKGDFSLYDNNNFIAVYASPAENSQEIRKHYGPILIDSRWEILRLTKDELRISSDVHGLNYILSFTKIGER